MAHLQQLFVSEGLPDRPYQTLDGRVSYKAETASAEMREVKEMKSSTMSSSSSMSSMKNVKNTSTKSHPITTEIHVTELRPIKLDPIGKRGQSVTQYPNNADSNKMWERRLQSESGVVDVRPHEMDFNYSAGDYQNNESHSQSHMTQSQSTTSNMQRSEVNVTGQPELQSNMIRTVTSRGGTYSGSSPTTSPSATMSPPSVRRREKLTAEFKRRDVSPDFKRTADQSITMVDGKCTCCPYGYHVDVDFMNYADTMSNQSYLKQLKRIQREKRKLRKSMEVYVQDQERTEGRTEIMNPMENHTHYQESTTNKILNEIDTSVDQTLNSIDTMMKTTQYSDSGSATMNAPQKFNTFPKKVGRQVAQQLQSYNETFTATLNNNDRADSNSSLSSISTVASERMAQPGYSTTETTTTKTTNMTSRQLAETMATHLPVEDGAASPQSNKTYISKESLHDIREIMASSLQRMKDLEEQVKAMPVLQVRISVLKEEKRLLSLQMQAKSQVKSVSRGVGDCTIDTPVVSPRFEFPLKSPPPTLPKPKVKMAAVGDHSVLEAYLLQPNLSPSYTTQDNSMHVFERETIIIDRAQKQHAMYTPESSKPLTRSVGTGEANVFDDSMHIHEKELRTVIIGQGVSTGKRNVGIECRPQTREVGVSYNFDTWEKPATRSVGCTTETSALVTSVSFKSEEFTSALKHALHRNVASKAIQVDSRPEMVHVGIQYATSAWDRRTVGSGDCSIDVEVRNPVARRNVSIEAYPDRMNHSTNTDYGWRLDAGTNTVSNFTEASWTQTEQVRKYTSFTNTEKMHTYNISCQTDTKVFAATDQLRTMGTNTEKTLTYSTGMNTILKPAIDRGVNTVTEKNIRNCGMNTEGAHVRNIGVSDDRIDSFICDLDDKDSEEEFRMEEEGVETKTVYYETEAEQIDTKREKGFELKREYVDETRASRSSQLQRSESESTESGGEEVVEEKSWQTSGDGQFTLTIVTTRKVFGGDKDGDVTRETKTISGGAEILGGDRDMILKEVAKGRRSSGSFYANQSSEFSGGSSGGFSGGSSGGFSGSISGGASSSASRSSSSMSSSSGGGRVVMASSRKINEVPSIDGTTAIERVLGSEFAKTLEEGNKESSEVSEEISGMSSSGMSSSGMSSSGMGGSYSSTSSGGGGGRGMASSSIRVSGGSSMGGSSSSAILDDSELDSMLGGLSDSGMSSSQTSSSSGVTMYKTIRQDGSGSPEITVTERRFGTRDGSPQRDVYSRSYDSGLSSQGSGGSSEMITTTTSTSSSQILDSGSPYNSLRSIMKKSQSDPGQQKRGITFAETVIGGDSDEETGESGSESSETEEGEPEPEEGGSRGTTSDDSDSSYDEGCYDSRAGSIIYKCKDDEAIANGIPGAKMFDQNIRETFELSGDMKTSCQTLATYLEDSTTIQTKQLNASLGVIQQEWFKVSSSKLADAHQVEDYLSCFNEISKRLLENIVNMQDSNGNTSIHYAVSNCNFEIVNLLLDTGTCDLDKQNKAGYTAVIMATLASIVTQRQEEVVQRLFSMGNVNSKAAKDGQTALMFAVRQGRTEMVKMLLDTGADTNIQDDEGSTALMCAAEHGHTEIIKMLLNNPGCDAAISDNDGSTALSIAMEAGHKDAGVLLYAHVNFGPGQSPATTKKTRKTSGSTSMLSST